MCFLVNFPFIGHAGRTGNVLLLEELLKGQVGVLYVSLGHFFDVVAVDFVNLLGVLVDEECCILFWNLRLFLLGLSDTMTPCDSTRTSSEAARYDTPGMMTSIVYDEDVETT